MAVDLHGRAVQLVRIVCHGHQRGLVAKPAGVEDRADLSQDVLALQLSETGQNVFLCGVQLVGKVQVGLLHHGERGLYQVEQLAVGHIHGHTLG